MVRLQVSWICGPSVTTCSGCAAGGGCSAGLPLQVDSPRGPRAWPGSLIRLETPDHRVARRVVYQGLGVIAFSALVDRCGGHDILGHVSSDVPAYSTSTRARQEERHKIREGSHMYHTGKRVRCRRETLPYRVQVHLPRKYWRSSCRGTWTPNLSSWAFIALPTNETPEHASHVDFSVWPSRIHGRG